MVRFVRAALFPLALLGAPAETLAWGDDGHRIICTIAWGLLNSDTRDRVAALLAEGPPGEAYRNLAGGCTWPDHVRNEPSYRRWRPTHAIRVPPEAPRVDPKSHCPEGRCLLGGLQHFSDELQRAGPPRERAEALLFVAHLVGDAHQPLHVSHADGVGGSHTTVRFWRPNALPELLDLHFVWDRAFLERRSGSDWEALARELALVTTPEERARWHSTEPLIWLDESLVLAVRHVVEVRQGDLLERSDYEAASAVLDVQLRKAGVRVAAVLEELLGSPRSHPAP